MRTVARRMLARRVFRGPYKPPPTFPFGRHCPAPGCLTSLSIYNAGPYCCAHQHLVTGLQAAFDGTPQ